ncbi:hypothetical protein QE152_g6893 [Popillia japonica]|uniref:Uncharacterized protein n=1 Tax=Popillia japonica TaxID=7064 RepID=A0AAW1MH09_POPJA
MMSRVIPVKDHKRLLYADTNRICKRGTGYKINNRFSEEIAVFRSKRKFCGFVANTLVHTLRGMDTVKLKVELFLCEP